MAPSKRPIGDFPETEDDRLQEERAPDLHHTKENGGGGPSPGVRPPHATADSESDTQATTIGPQLPHGGTRARPDLPPGLRIGAYRVQSVVGEGSMGVVYRAIQDNPNRVVALKVLKAGGASAESLRRFGQEAQVLGRLQHPGIAQIFEAGTSDTGFGPQPFFAMEMIDGVPLNEYANGRGLDLRARLELVIKVCEGVHHAHQKGVIHRDLKPSNIFVDQRGMPKILDFGVALATVGTTKSEIPTRHDAPPERLPPRLLVGTIPYMSVEQLRGWEAELDTRTDVYALGVIAYQLLSGSLPYDLGKKTAEQAVEIVEATQPRMLGEIDRRFRGDVELIVAKALQTDKALRYQAVSDFAADIRRFLADEPIAARTPGAIYQFRKFTKRNRALVVGALSVLIALLLAVVGTSIGLWRARQAEVAATRAEATKAAINDFLVIDILSAADPEQLGRGTTIQQALDVAGRKIKNGALADQPVVRAGVRMILGKTYRALGLYDEADEHLRVALEDYRAYLGAADSESLNTENELGLLRTDQGQYEQAESLLQSAWSARKQRFGGAHLETLESVNGLATLRLRRGEYVDAERLYRQVLETRLKVLGEDHVLTLQSMSDLAFALFKEKKLVEAEALYRRTLELQHRILSKDHPNTLNSTANLALVLKTTGKISDAEGFYRQALESYEHVLGMEHPTTLSVMNNLAALLKTRGQLQEATQLYHQTLETRLRVLGENHPDTLTSKMNLAGLMVEQEEWSEAESLYRETLADLPRVMGKDHPTTITAIQALALVLAKTGGHAEAEGLLRRALGLLRERAAGGSSDVDLGLMRLGMFLTERNRPQEAEPLFRECLAIRTAVLPEGDWRIANAQSALGECLTSLGRFDEAERLLLGSYEALTDKSGDWSHHQRKACERIVDLYSAWGQPDKEADWRNRLAAASPAP